MPSRFTRREWLKSGTTLATGIAFGAPSLQALATDTSRRHQLLARHYEARLLAGMPPLKARLFANENPFGPSEKAKQAIIDSLRDSYMYAFMSMKQLVSQTAQEEGVKEENILLGAGSSELLLAAALHYTLSTKGGKIVSADPSYTWMMEAAVEHGGGWEKVPLTKDYMHDLDGMEKRVNAGTSLVYICNPNNPTGTVVNPEKLRSFCEAVSRKKPVFVDEAYIDYTDDPKKHSMVDCVRKGQNVMVARTFSKLHAFAGLRVGYLVAQPATIKLMKKYCSGGFDMSAPSVAAATASLQDTEFREYARAKNAESKAFLCKTLKEEGYEYIPSHANFVLFPLKMNGKKFTEEMMKRGVGVRYWEFNNQQWSRVSMGTPEQMNHFAEAFRQLS